MGANRSKRSGWPSRASTPHFAGFFSTFDGSRVAHAHEQGAAAIDAEGCAVDAAGLGALVAVNLAVGRDLLETAVKSAPFDGCRTKRK